MSLQQRVVSVRLFGDTAVVSGTYIVRWRANGSAREERGIFTHIYNRARNHWACVNAQRTAVVDLTPGKQKSFAEEERCVGAIPYSAAVSGGTTFAVRRGTELKYAAPELKGAKSWPSIMCRFDGVSSEKMTSTRPTWAEVSRSRLVHNHDVLRRLAGPETELLCRGEGKRLRTWTGRVLRACWRRTARGGSASPRWKKAWRCGVSARRRGSSSWRVCGTLRRRRPFEHSLTPVVWERVSAGLSRCRDSESATETGQDFRFIWRLTPGCRGRVPPSNSWRCCWTGFGPGEPLRLEAVTTHFHSPQHEEATRNQERALRSGSGDHRREWPSTRVSERGQLSGGNLKRHGICRLNLARRIGAGRMVRPGIALYGYAPCQQNAKPDSSPCWNGRRGRFRSGRSQPGSTVGYNAHVHRAAQDATGVAAGGIRRWAEPAIIESRQRC